PGRRAREHDERGRSQRIDEVRDVGRFVPGNRELDVGESLADEAQDARRRMKEDVSGDEREVGRKTPGEGGDVGQDSGKRSPTSCSDTCHSRSAFSGSRAYDFTPSYPSGVSLMSATWQSSRYRPPRPSSSGAVAV